MVNLQTPSQCAIRGVSLSSIRPEIVAFVCVSHELLALDKLGIALTEEEENALADCLRQLGEQFFEARWPGVSGSPPPSHDCS